MYTTNSVSISEALLSPRKCRGFLKMLRENPLLQTVEMINTYTIGRRKTDSFQAQLWTHMLQHDGLKSISLHNTNCVPQKPSHGGNPTRSDKLRELSITFCDLNLASITWLRVHFASHHSLERLVLSDNGMRDDSIEMLCKMLRENNSVTYLDISNNNFGDAAMRYICCMLAEGADKTCKLSKLVLESNNLGDAGAILLAETLSASQQLKMLNVKDNNIGRRGIVALINTLWHNTGLDTLSLAFNYTDTSTEMLLQGALRANTTLRSLDVSMQQSDIISNWANDTVPYDNSNTQLDVVGLLRASLHIHYIRFDGVHTSACEIGKIPALLAAKTSLCRISFAGCGLSLSDVNQLAHGIGQNMGIEHLDLSNNELCVSSRLRGNTRVLGAEFWTAISRNTTLQVLKLPGNKLDIESMWHVATFLAANTTLLQLDIANNNIGGMGALVVLHALAKNKCLQQLDLRRNTTYSVSFSKLLSNIIKQRICMQQQSTLHVHGIAFYITKPELQVFKSERMHRSMQLTKDEIVKIWTRNCIERKLAFMLLTNSRLYRGPLTRLCVDTLRIILSFNIMLA